MAQQTINVGTAPNDGTGTPLRTAFQYTNSNFSELYTAVGPSGNNIVVPGSATITGDLTVDTSTLKVDSTNNRVGIGTATPAEALTVAGKIRSVSSTFGLSDVIAETTAGTGTGYARLIVKTADREWRLINDASTSGSPFIIYDATANAESLRIATAGVFTFGDGAGGTRMTLNSTGLGVGVTPAAGDGSGVFKAAGTGSLTANSRVGLDVRELVSGNQAGIILGAMTTENTAVIGSRTASGNIAFQTFNGASWGERMRIDYLGNLGIGVTPSAWSNSGNIDLANGFIGISSSGTYGGAIANNAYYNAGWKYKAANYANLYLTGAGEHKWLNAPVGAAAGNAITFTQAMTLDASGRLLVGTTDSGSNSGIGLKAAYSATAPYFATVGSSNASNTYSYLLYSTTDAAFKFYVSYSGQISATSGTISAISDARLKENVQDIDVGLGAILALKPRKFDWKAGKGKDIKGDRGFIAQEFEQVFPNLIDEWKDPAPEGEAPYKSVRQDLIPVLVKAIQELTAEVNALKNA